MAPDERALRADLASARFLAGEDRGRWALRELRWPHLFADVVAPDARRFTLRLDCTGFPARPPTGTFWDMAANVMLAFGRWPTGGERIGLTFRPDWKNGSALYIPCDRETIAGHNEWPSQYPQLLWQPDKGISHYLGVVHDLLQSRDYARAAA